MFGKARAEGYYDHPDVEEPDEELFTGTEDDGDNADEAWTGLDAEGPDTRRLTWDEPDPALFDAD
jgi:hypothetical protein